MLRLWPSTSSSGSGAGSAATRRESARPIPTSATSLRLDVKKLRYAAEFLAGLYAKRPKMVERDRFIAALKDLQDRLGDLNDAEAAGAMTERPAGQPAAWRRSSWRRPRMRFTAPPWRPATGAEPG